MAEETLFTWLHLSDIHAGAGPTSYQWDAKLVVDQLRRDLGRDLKSDLPAVDAILVTGDLAFSGNGRSPTEYEQVGEWLRQFAETCRVKPSDVYMVPGNHDVDRAVVDGDADAKDSLAKLRKPKGDLDAALADMDDLGLMQRRLEAYLRFEGSGFASVDGDSCGLFWSRRVEPGGGLAIRLIGLNTALLCQDNKDKGRLRFGNRQLATALGECKDDELVVLMTHHPFDWLADGSEANRWAQDRVHIHLYGHVHDHESESRRAGGNTLGRITIAAGAVHTDPTEPDTHGLSVASVVRTKPGKLVLRIWPYKWSSKRKDLRRDVENIPKGKSFAEHALNLPEAVAPPAPFLLDGKSERPKKSGPAALLNARHEEVRFLDSVRQRELDTLSEWCDRPESTNVRLFTGPGGSGKTRLFIEWTERLRKKGWHAGFLGEDAGDEQIETLLAWPQPTLAVLDYAETRPALGKLLEQVARRPADEVKPLRVVLLAREIADWWRSLLGHSATVHDLLYEHEPYRIEQVPLEGELRRKVFFEARDRFAVIQGKTPATDIPSLEDERFGRVLYLHMAALAVVEGFAPDADSLLDEVVEREVRFWGKTFTGEFKNDRARRMFEEKAARFVAGVTLRGGLASVEDAEALRGRVDGPAGEEFLQVMRDLYPGRSGQVERRYVSPLEPDLLGECLVAKVLSDANTPVQYLNQVFDGVSAEAMRNGFVVLGRIAARMPEEGSDWLGRLLGADVIGRARPAFAATMSIGAETAFCPLGAIMAEMLEKLGSNALAELAAEFERAMPEQAVSLRELAVWATERTLEALGDSPTEEPVLVERTRLLNNLGARLGEIGRREEALSATAEAADISRKLAYARPDAFLPDLAMNLNNVGIRLGELGRHEEALAAITEAVEIRRKLAVARPNAFLPKLAVSLSNMGNRLSQLGRPEEALKRTAEAAETFRKLAAVRPNKFLPDLAMSLNNLSVRLSKLGRREEALAVAAEAVDIYRKLASARPDAFLPELAASLINLGLRLGELGHREQAVAAAAEAVVICRKLASARPDAFLPELAASLTALGSGLGEIGRQKEGLEATAEAVAISRRLTSARPEAFEPDLAIALNNLGLSLGDMGRWEEALAATTEAVKIYRKLASARPDAYLADVAMSLNNMGNALGEVNRREEAVAVAGEAVETYRKLASARPDAYLPVLAGSLNNVGVTLSESGCREEALAATVESVEIYGRLVEGVPGAFGRDFMDALKNLLKRFEECGRPEGMVGVIERAIEIARKAGLIREKSSEL